MSTNAVPLGKTENNRHAPAITQNKIARIAGILYLVIIISGIFAEFFVRTGLIVPGDAAATADNILTSEMLFRAGIATDLIMIIADIGLALAFYVLFKPVSNALSLGAAFFRLAQAIILGFNLLNLFFALHLAGAGTEQSDALAMLFLNAHDTGYAIGLVFFGISLFILSYLILKSGYLPRVLGILLMLASFGYLADTFARVLLPTYEAYAPLFDLVVFTPAVIAELAMALWLLIKGVRLPAQESEASITTPQAEGAAA